MSVPPEELRPVLDAEVASGVDAGPRLEGVTIAVDARFISHPGIGFYGYLTGAVALLIESGARVCLLTNFSPEPYRELFPDAEWIGFGNRRNVIWEQFDLPRLLRRREFDIYWAPANVGIPMVPLKGTWRISTTHDLVPLRLPRLYLRHHLGFALPYLLWTSAGMLRSDTVLTVSHSSARDIQHFFRRTAVVIPPVFTSVASGASTDDLPEALDGREYVVYNGGLDPRKNVANLLAGFAHVARERPRILLVLVGSGYGHFDDVIGALGLDDRVVRTGYVSEAIKSAILASAAVLAYPSMYEGFGLPLLEAFAAGTPVLTSANSSLDEVAGDAAVYVDPLDPSSIARGITDTLRPELARALRAKGFERLRQFEPATSRDRLVDELVDALRRQRRPGLLHRTRRAVRHS